jgi:hypothetical protein
MKKEITEKEEIVLKVFGELTPEDEEYCLFMNYVSDECGFKVRRFVRSLARKGYLELIRGLFNDDGMLAGSGYTLTNEGRQYLKNLKKHDIKYNIDQTVLVKIRSNGECHYEKGIIKHIMHKSTIPLVLYSIRLYKKDKENDLLILNVKEEDILEIKNSEQYE